MSNIHLPSAAVSVIRKRSHPVVLLRIAQASSQSRQQRLRGRPQGRATAVIQALDLRLTRRAEDSKVHLLGHIARRQPILQLAPARRDGRGRLPWQVDLESGDLVWCSEGVELEGRNDAKVGSSATQGPEEVRILGWRGSHYGGVGEYDRGGGDPVNCKTVGVRREAEAAVQGVASYSDSV